MNVGDPYNPRGLFKGVFIPDAMARMPNSQLSSGAKLCFARLAWHVSDEGECFPDRATLASEIGVSEFSVRDYLKELEDAGFIRRIRNGPHTNDYEFPWHAILEDCLRRKDRQPSVDQEKKDRQRSVDQENERPTVGCTKDRHSAVSPSLLVREELREGKNTPPTPSSNSNQTLASPERKFRLWCDHRGFKKPSRSQRAAIMERLAKVEMTEEEFIAALDGFSRSAWAIEHEFPIFGFLKDPYSWIAKACEIPEAPPTEEWDDPAPAAAAEPTPPARDFVAEWNEAVPAAPTEWHPQHSPVKELRARAADPDFCARFADVCANAQQALEARGGDVSWITFEWVIRLSKDGRPNWWRLLNDLKGFTQRKAPRTKSEQVAESIKNVVAQVQRHREQQQRERIR